MKRNIVVLLFVVVMIICASFPVYAATSGPNLILKDRKIHRAYVGSHLADTGIAKYEYSGASYDLSIWLTNNNGRSYGRNKKSLPKAFLAWGTIKTGSVDCSYNCKWIEYSKKKTSK